MNLKIEITTKQRILEILLVLVTGLGKIVIMDVLNLKLPFIIIIVLFWSLYVIIRTKNQKGILKYWGFSITTSKELFKIILPIGLFLALAIIFYGVFVQPINWSINILFVVIAYPIWGLIQQFLILSLFAGNIKDLSMNRLNDLVIILLTSILFSIVHFPSWQLITATFIMALIYTPLYLKYRNLIPLGLFHGIIGGLFYFVILNSDAWLEFVSKYL